MKVGKSSGGKYKKAGANLIMLVNATKREINKSTSLSLLLLLMCFILFLFVIPFSCKSVTVGSYNMFIHFVFS